MLRRLTSALIALVWAASAVLALTCARILWDFEHRLAVPLVKVIPLSLARFVPVPEPAPETEEEDPPAWLGVAASPYQSGVVAAFDERELRVSRDGGESFPTVVPLPISAAAVSPEGLVYAILEDGRLLVVDAAGVATIRSGPYSDFVGLAVGPGRIAVLSTSYSDEVTLQVSRDGGLSFRAFPNLEKHAEGLGLNVTDLAFDERGRVLLWGNLYEGGDCGADYDMRWRVSPDGSVRSLTWPEEIYEEPLLMGLEGWSYTTCGSGESQACSVDPDGALRLLPGVELSIESRVIRGRKVAYLSDERRLYRVERGRAELLSKALPEDFEPMAVDADERFYGLIEGEVVSWSSAGGRVLLRAPGAQPASAP